MADILRAINAVSKVIDNSNSEVLLVSGALSHEVYGSSEVKQAIERALNERHVKFDIITGPNPDPESKYIIETLANNICEAGVWPESHFVVGDRKHFRFEQPHLESSGTPAEDNMLVFDAPEAARLLVQKFQQLKQVCTPLKMALKDA